MRTGHPVARPVGDLHNERVGAVQDVALHAMRHPAQGGVGQRLFALENALTRNAPVDALGCRAPALLAFDSFFSTCMTLKICIAQLNFVVGDLAGNAQKIGELNVSPDLLRALIK